MIRGRSLFQEAGNVRTEYKNKEKGSKLTAKLNLIFSEIDPKR